MVGLLSLSIYLAAMRMLYKRSAMLFMIVLIFPIIWIWKLVSAIYIDLNSNVFASEINRMIGGGSSSIRLSLIYMIIVLSIVMIFNTERLNKISHSVKNIYPRSCKVFGIELDMFILISIALFVVVSYVDVFQYQLPFFSGISKNVFMLQYNGVYYRLLLKYINYISLFLGVLLFYAIIGKDKRRYLPAGIFIFILILLSLLGHKFSPHIINLSLFLLPLWLLVFLNKNYLTKKESYGFFLIFILIIFLSFGSDFIYKIQTYVKADPVLEIETNTIEKPNLNKFLRYRIFISEAQNWWTAYERVFVNNNWNFTEAFRYIFVKPLYPSISNSAAQYLMYRDIGQDAFRHFKVGAIYAVGYPENILELFGPYFIYVIVCILALIFAELLYLFLLSVSRCHYLSIIAIAFVLKPFFTLHINGPINYFTWKLLVKIALMIFALLYDYSKFTKKQSGYIRQ